MKKRITALALALTMVLGIAAVAAGTEKTITVTPMTMTINGQTVTPTKSDGTPAEVFAYDGATYVPLRYLSELLGIKVDWDANDNTTAKLVGDNLKVPAAGGDGTYTGTGSGFGGEITATVTVSGGKVTACTLKGDKETPAIGGAALEKLQAQVVAAGGADIDGVSGATGTSNGVKAAVADAMGKAAGAAAAAVKMKPGTYTGYADGFHVYDGITVTVEVSETKMLSVKVDAENTGDTTPIVEDAAELLVPRMLANQSVSVDAITGATASSNAIKAATAAALTEALKAGGSDASALKNFQVVPEKKGGKETIDTEVLVIGMGGSGISAAMSAAEQGLDVLAIEKQGRYGGTSALTDDVLAVNPSKYKAEFNGGKDYVDADALYKDWIDYTEGDAKEEIVSRMINESGDVIDWLTYEHGFVFAEPGGGLDGDNSFSVKFQWLPYSEMWNKSKLGGFFDILVKDYVADGGKYMLETEGYELITDAKGNVTGAKARNLADGTEYTINAKAVVIACGGYLGSTELQEQFLRDDYYPLTGDTWGYYGSLGNDGKMLKAALNIGAGLYNISMPPEVHLSSTRKNLPAGEYEPHYVEGEVGGITGRPAYWLESELPANMGWSQDSMAVDREGRRFTSEEGLSFLDPWIAGPTWYSIWSDEQVQKLITKGFDTVRSGLPSGEFMTAGSRAIPENVPMTNGMQILKDAEEAGIVVKADTLEELAKKLDMDPSVLKKTVDTYNGYCKTGKDKQFNKDAKYLDQIGSKGPYYAVVMGPYAYGSCGGLDINEHLQVLKEDGKTAIKGLYAVGTDSMGVLFSEKKPYVTYGGANNGWAMTSGYMVGPEIADYLGKK